MGFKLMTKLATTEDFMLVYLLFLKIHNLSCIFILVQSIDYLHCVYFLLLRNKRAWIPLGCHNTIMCNCIVYFSFRTFTCITGDWRSYWGVYSFIFFCVCLQHIQIYHVIQYACTVISIIFTSKVELILKSALLENFEKHFRSGKRIWLFRIVQPYVIQTCIADVVVHAKQ